MVVMWSTRWPLNMDDARPNPLRELNDDLDRSDGGGPLTQVSE